MARTHRIVEVRITAVSLLFSYSTNIFQIISYMNTLDITMQDNSIIIRNLNIKRYHD